MERFVTAVIAFIITVILCPAMIPFLKKLKFGQSILEIGPSWHSSKAGTPTMGGLVFIIASVAAVLLYFKRLSPAALLVVCSSAGFGAIGFIDDFIKVVLKRNLGLRAWQKLALQITVSIFFVFTSLQLGIISTVIEIPFARINLDLDWIYIPFAILALVFGTNSVNLTDGIDGLASSVTTIVLLFLGLMSFNMESVSWFCFSLAGALLGFLIFNRYPAKVFMGDTGSLFLGGAVCSVAIINGNPLILLVVGFIYFIESFSVILQVASFKLTGKRLFKMSPIHHHFEMSGWKEVKIVKVFSAVTLLLCIIAYLLAG